MEFETLIETLDSKFSRQLVDVPNYKTTLSYQNPGKLDITINETTYEKPQRLCLITKNNNVFLYINTILLKRHKINIEDIEDVEC